LEQISCHLRPPLTYLYHWHNLHVGCAISWNGIHTLSVSVCVCLCLFLYLPYIQPSIYPFIPLSICPSIYTPNLSYPHPSIHPSVHPSIYFFYLILLSEIWDHLIFVLVIKHFLLFYINPLSAVQYCFFTGW